VKQLIKYLEPFKAQVIAVIVLVFLQSMADLYLPTLMSDIIDHGVVKGDVPYIWKIGGIMLLVAAGGLLCAILSSFFSARTAVGFGRNLRNEVFIHVENFSQEEFDRLGTASLITRTTNDILQVQNVLMFALRIMITAPIMAVGGIIMAMGRDAHLTLIFLVILPVLALTIFFIARKAIGLFKAIQKKLDALNRVLREYLTGVRVIRAFNRTGYEEKRFDAANRDLTETTTAAIKIMSLIAPAMTLIVNLSTIAIVWFGAMRIDNNRMEVGDLMAFIQYAMQIMFSLLMVSILFIMIPRAQVSAERINEILDTEPAIEGGKGSRSASAKGWVEFQNVSFSYPGAEAPALSDISFKAGPGEVTAIIGGTGAGKSTLVQLIPRFYDATEGRVLVDGIDVRDWPLEELRKKIGYVPQKTVLFSGTVAENIRFGKEDASFEEIRHAAEAAQAADFIEEMKEKYETVIAQGGTNLSGGQKQRLAIARALVRKPDIYIFDDSFSALDFKTDAKLRQALRKEKADAAVILIAQRVATVMDADRIIVLNEGKIAGIGKHQELLKTCPVYREIVASQLSEEEIA